MATAHCIFAARIEGTPGKSCHLHRHSCTELVWFKEGTGHCNQGGQRLSYNEGMVLVCQPDTYHDDHPHTPSVQLCVGVSGCDSESLPQGVWPLHAVHRALFKSISEVMADTEHDNRQDKLDLLSGLLVVELKQTLQEGSKLPSSKESSQSDFIHKAQDILDANFDKPINLKELASSLYVSSDHLRHTFKERFGESPINYLIRRRLDAACEILTMTDLPMRLVAEKVGLDSPYYFSRLFRKRMGVTPSQYRQNMK